MKYFAMCIAVVVILTGCTANNKANLSSGSEVYLRGEQIQDIGLILNGKIEIDDPISSLYTVNSIRLKQISQFYNLRGEFTEICASYHKGGLAVDSIPVMVLQGYKKTALEKTDSFITINDKDFNVIDKYKAEDLSQYIVYEDDTYVVYDMLYPMTKLEFPAYLDMLEGVKEFSLTNPSAQIDESFLDDKGKITFDWVIKLYDKLISQENILVKK